MQAIIKPLVLALAAAGTLSAGACLAQETPEPVGDGPMFAFDSFDSGYRWEVVRGTGIHYFSTAIQHSEIPTETAVIARSTDTIDLDGDIVGRVVYHPVTTIDFQTNTLTNVGDQVFSGTVLGSEPVLIHDDEFRFEVDLATGETFGTVHLVDRISGPNIRCHLQITGTGMTEAGDGLASYQGVCKMPRNPEE